MYSISIAIYISLISLRFLEDQVLSGKIFDAQCENSDSDPESDLCPYF
jgi:hypothetical protein